MKKTEYLVSSIIYFLSLFLISFIVLNAYLYVAAWSAASQSKDFANRELMRIKIYGSTYNETGNTVSANFAIIDSNGNEIAVIERSWNGSYLAVEFSTVNLCNKTFVFPKKVFGRDQISSVKAGYLKGTSLEKYYDDYGQCMLLDSKYTYKDRINLYKIARIAVKKMLVIPFGFTSIYTVDLSNCKNDVYYSIGVDNNSNLYISEL